MIKKAIEEVLVGIEDFLVIEFETHSTNLQPGEELSINFGFNAEFEDKSNTVWLPDQEFKAGSYGYGSGQSYMVNKDLIVTNAGQRPVLYNYSLEGADTYQLAVPDGLYLVEMHFAESHYYHPGKRIFDVQVNEISVLRDLDMVNEYGFLHALSKSIQVEAKESKGIQIQLKSRIGKTSMSALQLMRLN